MMNPDSTYTKPFLTLPEQIRLDTFVPGTSLEHVVSLYEFDGELRTRLGGVLSMGVGRRGGGISQSITSRWVGSV